MKRNLGIIAALVTASWFALSGAAFAVPVTWADWTSANATTASGHDRRHQRQLQRQHQSGRTDRPAGRTYWAVNPAIFTAPGLDNGPPDSDIIRLNGGNRYRHCRRSRSRRR